MDSVNGPQTQTFTYDTLDRLTSAAAAGGADGLYNETYSYNPSTGNLAAKGSLNLTYADSAHPHAATGLSNGNTYAYNAVGSTTTRVIGADTYSLAYDSENRLKTVQKNGAVMAEFKYDGDGTRVQSTINGVTTRFVGQYYEVTDSVVTKYYGGSAMRVGGTLAYLLSDHLGSNSLILDTAGNVVGETRYTAWGEERYSSGSVSTDYTYTGQYSNTDDFGLMYYKARWYDPQLGRFAQADSIVPGVGNPVSWDRYAYVGNNPVISSDSTGHFADNGCNSTGCNINLMDQIDQEQNDRIDDIQSDIELCNSGNDLYCSPYQSLVLHSQKPVFGINYGYSGQVGYGVEGEFFVQEDWILDLYTGTLYKVVTVGGGGYGGSPTLMNGEVYGGLSNVYGIPYEVQDITTALEGPQLEGSISGGVDAMSGFGVSKGASVDLTEDGKPVYTPGTGFMYTLETDMEFSVNLFPNGIEAGVFGGISESFVAWSKKLW